MRTYQNQPSGTVARARQLRRAASPIERRLLRGLRDAFPHLKWRHQVPLGPFYADMFCFSESLVIEVDGDSHAETAARDASRTALIESEGYRLIRFTNLDVTQNLEGVLTDIATHLSSPSPPGATRLPPLPLGEGKSGRGSHESITFMGPCRPRRGEGDAPNKKGGAA